MKKLFSICLLLFISCSLFSQNRYEDYDLKKSDGRISNKQVVVGIRGGINFNYFGKDVSKVWDANSKRKEHFGWNLGIVFDVPILESFYFQPGAYYKTKGFRVTESNPAYDRMVKGNANYAVFPLLFSYRLNIKGGMDLEFNLGPYIGIGFKGKVRDVMYSYLLDPDNPDPDEGIFGSNGSPSFIKVEEVDMFGDNRENSFGIKKSDLGVVIVTGITINRFYIGLQYDMGL